MKTYRILAAAAVSALCLAASGCSGSQKETSTPSVEYTKLTDPAVETDQTGAEIEVLNLENPIDFDYSNAESEMVFKMSDGVWIDGMESSIPINQERFASVAEPFLHLRAVSKLEDPGDFSEYGLDHETYSVYITDSEQGDRNILIGNQDENGNYYMTVNEVSVYTIKPETVNALVFDYNSLVIRDSLELTVTADDIVSASFARQGETTKLDSSSMERIAAGITALRPVEFASYEASSSELFAADLGSDTRTTFRAELKQNGETRSLTVYIGGFADAEQTIRYVQLDGSSMIAIVDNTIISDLLDGNDTVEETVSAVTMESGQQSGIEVKDYTIK